jgi:hypothetical protein
VGKKEAGPARVIEVWRLLQEDYERKIETKLREMHQMYVGRPQPQQQAQPQQQPRMAASAVRNL